MYKRQEYNLTGNTSLVGGITFNNGFTNLFSQDVHLADGNGNAVEQFDNLGNLKQAKDALRTESAKAINNMIVLNVGILF